MDITPYSIKSIVTYSTKKLKKKRGHNPFAPPPYKNFHNTNKLNQHRYFAIYKNLLPQTNVPNKSNFYLRNGFSIEGIKPHLNAP